MSKIMTVAGIILLGIGLALGLVGLVSPARLGAMFLTLDSAAILLVGGILSAGLGGVIAALENGAKATARVQAPVDQLPLPGTRGRMDEAIRAAAAASKPELPASLPELRRAAGEASEAAKSAIGTTAMGAAAVSIEMSENTVPEITSSTSASVAETINALERAKSDMRAAFGGNGGAASAASSPIIALKPATPANPSVAIPPPHDEPEDEEPAAVVEEEIVEANGELYVVEEKTIRGRPARVLSDGTVEAETDEGWMRFENIEHLNEYLDG